MFAADEPLPCRDFIIPSFPLSVRRSAVVFLALVGIRKVAGFLFGLLLPGPHMIQLVFVEHDPDRVIPA